MAKKPTAADLMDALTAMETAQRASMVALVRALEQKGAISAEYYGDLLRLSSASIAERGMPGAAMRLDDLADALKRDEGPSSPPVN